MRKASKLLSCNLSASLCTCRHNFNFSSSRLKTRLAKYEIIQTLVLVSIERSNFERLTLTAVFYYIVRYVSNNWKSQALQMNQDIILTQIHIRCSSSLTLFRYSSGLSSVVHTGTFTFVLALNMKRWKSYARDNTCACTTESHKFKSHQVRPTFLP